MYGDFLIVLLYAICDCFMFLCEKEEHMWYVPLWHFYNDDEINEVSLAHYLMQICQ